MAENKFQKLEDGYIHLNGVRYSYTVIPATNSPNVLAKKKRLSELMSPHLLRKARKLSKMSDEGFNNTIDNDILKDKKARLIVDLDIKRFHAKYRQTHPEYFTVTEEERANKRIKYRALVDCLSEYEMAMSID